MHLIELIAELEAAKVARGNIRLVDVIVMAAGDAKGLVDYADRSAARQQATPVMIDVTGMSEDQIDELLAENGDAKLIRRTVEPSTAPSELCHTPNCRAGEVGHEGECIIAQDVIEEEEDDPKPAPAALLATSTGIHEVKGDGSTTKISEAPQTVEMSPEERAAAAKELEAMLASQQLRTMVAEQLSTDETAKAGHGPRSCPQWDGKGKACDLAYGHDGDHVFSKPTHRQNITEEPAASNPGDAGLPDNLQE